MTLDVRRAGDDALLVDAGSLDGALAVLGALSDAVRLGQLSVTELIPAARTVLVRGASEQTDPGAFREYVAGLLAERSAGSAQQMSPEVTTIDVVYTGQDLAAVAELTGLSIDDVVELHTASRFTVAFTGFAPGFAYLSGGDQRLTVPRRSTPRPRIPAGSVGLAGEFSGVYPRQSPGGWQLIGHTEHPMWDLSREQPAALVPGAEVRFRAVREQLNTASATASAAAPNSTTTPTEAATQAAAAQQADPQLLATNHPALTVLNPGLQSLVQDEGRPGQGHLGVSASGAADRGALARANRLVGNPAGAAALELRFGDFSARAETTLVAALTGAPRKATARGPLGTRELPFGAPFRLTEGETLDLAAAERGVVTTLALRGGVVAPEVLGSVSRDTLAGLGPEALAAGDLVSVGVGRGLQAVRESLGDDPRLAASGDLVTLGIVLGPRDDWFSRDSLERLTTQEWLVTPRSDRVGVRLEGEALERSPQHEGLELPSEGLVTGAIQVPPDGQPVLFHADRPLTGGYPVIGVVRAADLDSVAQLPPGVRVRFALVDPAKISGPGRPTPTPSTKESSQ
ncbi:5-oxoprolinase/urea amidolyase family protein [Leucobacter chinensis]|uniref:5-oxoprolinase subunit B/C family protein n=1 Tax=Leucobacter chinensis TaxID=2851010 RepID=UPI001C2483FE